MNRIDNSAQQLKAVQCFREYFNSNSFREKMNFREEYSDTYNLVEGVIVQNHNERSEAASWLTHLTRHFLIFAITQLNVGIYGNTCDDKTPSDNTNKSEDKESENERDASELESARNAEAEAADESENTKSENKGAINHDNQSNDAQLLLSALLVLLNRKEWSFGDVHNLLMTLFETFHDETTFFMNLLTLMQYNVVTPMTRIHLTSEHKVATPSTGKKPKKKTTRTVREVLTNGEKTWLYALSNRLRPVADQIEFYSDPANSTRRFARCDTTIADLVRNMFITNKTKTFDVFDVVRLAGKEKMYKTSIRHALSKWNRTIKKLNKSDVPPLQIRLKKNI